ncbi:MAG: Octaprenyl-diphosphate synthase [Syntrophorhabdaceae bacterium PtaU1.Bin034]|jgi:octaprenyl-diphosphate synthase|nr:MAG: Octaprenyl-diphosphate synthase [Syntrophorhabdaceae bacterium PtaU1.Bin034]
MEEIVRLIREDLDKLEKSIDRLLTTRISFIREVVHHLIKSGGKRIRPILVILSSRLCGCFDDQPLSYAAIVEFIHTATLLHDDVVDNAETRRGAQTANTVWGNESSVLVGDFLFSKSFDLMVSDNKAEILRVLSKATTDLAEGEILELLKTSDIDTTEEEYYEVILGKTAVLLSAACEIGALLGNAEEKKRRALHDFGYHIGMAFQLTDDLLDYTSTDKTLGKDAGRDLKEGKVTLPLINALKSATEEEKASIGKGLTKKRVTTKDFRNVKKVIEKYGGIAYTAQVSKKHIEDAKALLNIFPASPYKKALLDLADYIVARES